MQDAGEEGAPPAPLWGAAGRPASLRGLRGASGQWLLQPAPLCPCVEPGAGGRGRPGGGAGASGEALSNSSNRETEQASADGSVPSQKVPSQHSALPSSPLLQSQAGRGDAQGQGTSIPWAALSSTGTRSHSRPPASREWGLSLPPLSSRLPPPGGGREVGDIGAWTAPRLSQISLWFLETSKASPHPAPPPSPSHPGCSFPSPAGGWAGSALPAQAPPAPGPREPPSALGLCSGENCSLLPAPSPPQP